MFEVQNQLGPTMLEKHYQRAIEKEFFHQGIKFEKEYPITLRYKGENIGKYFLDFLVEEKVILETKAVKTYNPKFFKQVFAYLKQSHLPLALLINFKKNRLEYQRIINPDYKDVDLTQFDQKFEFNSKQIRID